MGLRTRRDEHLKLSSQFCGRDPAELDLKKNTARFKFRPPETRSLDSMNNGSKNSGGPRSGARSASRLPPHIFKSTYPAMLDWIHFLNKKCFLFFSVFNQLTHIFYLNCSMNPFKLILISRSTRSALRTRSRNTMSPPDLLINVPVTTLRFFGSICLYPFTDGRVEKR
jgi:hypothetical protein